MSIEKSELHPKNLHRAQYDFDLLCSINEALIPHVFINKYKNKTIDFSDPHAVKALNKAILMHFYDLKYWDIPEDYLCPPIPGRADYIHYLADLLCYSNLGVLPEGNRIKVLDVGVGANCIYPIIGCKSYDWNFVGSDIDVKACESAKKIIENNSNLNDKVEIRLQPNKDLIFKGIISPDEMFDLTICNPPFHKSAEEAFMANDRKNKNLGLKTDKKTKLNFGGMASELWCEGGEVSFLKKMIEESASYPISCFWYTSLISKRDSLVPVKKFLNKAKVSDIKIIKMTQGQKESRFIAWTFLNKEERDYWRKMRWV